MSANSNADDAAANGIITLLTDFGLSDPFVGVMKGAVLSAFREATLVDLTHGIAPQDVAQAAFWLECSFRWFPRGAVHVAVVDPGVGSARAPLVARAAGHFFVGPDNGVLGAVLEGANAVGDGHRGSEPEIREIDVSALARRLGLGPPSHTFHGRDIFAPAAALLASGAVEFSELGSIRATVEPSPLPRPDVTPGRIEGAVVCVDRFGNLVTNIGEACLVGLQRPRVQIAGIELRIAATYSTVASGDHVALVDSFGMLEIARRDGSAAATLEVSVGAKVVVIHES